MVQPLHADSPNLVVSFLCLLVIRFCLLQCLVLSVNYAFYIFLTAAWRILLIASGVYIHFNKNRWFNKPNITISFQKKIHIYLVKL